MLLRWKKSISYTDETANRGSQQFKSQASQDCDPLLKVCSVVHHTFYPLPHLILSIVCRQRKLSHFFYLFWHFQVGVNSFLLLHDQELRFPSLYLISCFYTWQTLHPLISDSHCIHFHAQSILDCDLPHNYFISSPYTWGMIHAIHQMAYHEWQLLKKNPGWC